MKTKLILGLVLLLGLSIGADAQTLRGKDRGQHQRIEQGRRSGELTRGRSPSLITSATSPTQSISPVPEA
ncbi:hypothetical protein [Paraflavitalea speifideaquila]|uniref:hypothetical protein n=1 Tax=Paraflavitalea speifideaquila TaxID=3076558 RepID=UPI0028E35E48|nr:hypothetical protein [Paraflavitalea speifideiaquila]